MTTLAKQNLWQRCVLLLTAGLSIAMAGCLQKSEPPEIRAARPAHTGPYADGKAHVETVRFNGRDYRVRLRRLPGSDAFALKVSAPGRALGGTPGDLKIVRQVALSTLRHYACRSGHRAEALPDSARHAKGAWHLMGRCV